MNKPVIIAANQSQTDTFTTNKIIRNTCILPSRPAVPMLSSSKGACLVGSLWYKNDRIA